MQRDHCVGYLEQGLPFAWLLTHVKEFEFDQDFIINELNFTRSRAWLKTFPVSFRIGAFILYLNRTAMYIQVTSLGLEMKGFKGIAYWLKDILDRLMVKPKLKQPKEFAESKFNQVKTNLNGDNVDSLFEYDLSPNIPWFEYLTVSRIDTYCDFIYDGNFNPNQFKTRLSTKATFESQNGGITYYWGDRSVYCVRLYRKDVESAKHGKEYLKAAWQDNERYTGQNVWRLEFEFRKRKLDELGPRQLAFFLEQSTIDRLWHYGIENLQYMEKEAQNRNLDKNKVHPLWQQLNKALMSEYSIELHRVRQYSLDFRYMMARKYVLSYYALQANDYLDIPLEIIQTFKISEEEFNQVKINSVWDLQN